MTDKSYVTLERKQCPICGVIHDKDCGLLVDTRLKKRFDMYTTTGLAICSDCQKKLDDNYLAMIIVDETKSEIINDKVKLQDAHRTGELMWIKRDAANHMFGQDLSEWKFIFADTALAKQLKERSEHDQSENNSNTSDTGEN